MSGGRQGRREWMARLRGRVAGLAETVRRRTVPILFGDRVGLALFLGVLVVLSLLWRVGFFITDTYAIANTVVNLADGHLNIARIEYSLTLGSQPGLYEHGGRVFGRNYGQAALAVPIYWLLEGLTAITELRLVLAGTWSLLAAGFAAQLGRVLDRPNVTIGGTILALAMFVANVALATPLDPRWNGLLALQSVSLVAAGVVAVALYRLGREFHGQRVGIAGGLLGSLALPVAFWATIPKRHVMSAALLAIVVFGFARSRRADRPLPARALAYAAVGMLAWLHAAEALIVLVVLVPFDLATARSNGARELVAVAAVFTVALVPFALTNVAITGSPLTAPRMLSNLGGLAELGPGGEVVVDGGGQATPTPDTPTQPPDPTTTATNGGTRATTSGGTTAPGSTPNGTATPGTGTSDGTGPPTGPDGSGGAAPGIWTQVGTVLGGLFGLVIGAISGTIGLFGRILTAVVVGFEVTAARIGELWGYVSRGIGIAFGNVERLGDVFVRSGRVPGVRYAINDQEAVELAVLEVAPVLGVLVAMPIVLAKRGFQARKARLRRLIAAIRTTPRYQTDLFVGTLVLAFTLLYLPRLPLYSQITVRYLVPVMPVAVYGVLRLPSVRRGLSTEFRVFLGTYVGTTVVGVVGVSVVLVTIDPAIGEAMQLHALVNLAITAVVTAIVSLDSVIDRKLPVGPAMGVVGGAGTTLFVLAGIEYFTYGQFALPIAEWVSAILPLL